MARRKQKPAVPPEMPEMRQPLMAPAMPGVGRAKRTPLKPKGKKGGTFTGPRHPRVAGGEVK